MNAQRYYILRFGVPVLEPDPMRWAIWHESGAGVLEETVIRNEDDHMAAVCVTTLFAGFDLRLKGDEGPPLLWQTQIAGLKLECLQYRYRSEKEAREAHWEVVALCRSQLDGTVVKALTREERAMLLAGPELAKPVRGVTALLPSLGVLAIVAALLVLALWIATP